MSPTAEWSLMSSMRILVAALALAACRVLPLDASLVDGGANDLASPTASPSCPDGGYMSQSRVLSNCVDDVFFTEEDLEGMA